MSDGDDDGDCIDTLQLFCTSQQAEHLQFISSGARHERRHASNFVSWDRI